VDKLDYFRRDAFYLGAKNIYIDHELLMNEARIVEGEICYPTKYVEIVYNIFHSRYKLYKNYYFNVINTGVEQMVCDILELTKEKFGIKRACEEIYTNPNKFMRLNDSILEKVEDVFEDMLERQDPGEVQEREKFEKAVNLLKRIRTRKLYKFVKELTYYVKDKEHEKVV
jgi:HD superfamily phosphohydrolase